jgi:hypothetical protein
MPRFVFLSGDDSYICLYVFCKVSMNISVHRSPDCLFAKHLSPRLLGRVIVVGSFVSFLLENAPT